MGIFFCEMEVNCPKQWDELTLTENPLVRDCADCGKPVHFIDTQEQLLDAMFGRKCVAFFSGAKTIAPDGEAPSPQVRGSTVKTVRMTLGLPRSPDNSKLRPFIDPMLGPEK